MQSFACALTIRFPASLNSPHRLHRPVSRYFIGFTSMAFCFFFKARFVQKSNAQYFSQMLTICRRFRRQCRLREVFDCVRTSLCINIIAGSLWSLCWSHPAVIKVLKCNALQKLIFCVPAISSYLNSFVYAQSFLHLILSCRLCNNVVLELLLAK